MWSLWFGSTWLSSSAACRRYRNGSCKCLTHTNVLQFFVEAGGEPGYKLLVNHLLPLLAKLVSDTQAEVSVVHYIPCATHI
jgi:hypothetical protein